MFAIAAGLMLAAVTVVLTLPLWRKAQTPGGPTREIPESPHHWERARLENERQALLTSLADLEMDHLQERLNPADYQRLKTIDEHRLVKTLEKLDTIGWHGEGWAEVEKRSPQPGMLNQVSATVLSVLVAGSAAVIYVYTQGKPQGFAVAQEAQSQGAQPRLNPLEMVARLEQRLQENPKDLQGQIMAGRSYMALQRWEEARKAWSAVLELDRRDHEAHFNLGWLLLQTRTSDDPRVFEKALSRFETALIAVPRDPTVLWYRGVALVYLKRYAEADANWTDAYQGLPPDSDEAKVVAEALTRLRAGKPPLL